MIRPTRVGSVAVVLLIVPLLALVAVRPLDRRLGLLGTYYSRIDWSGAAHSRFDYRISTDALRAKLRYSENRPFAVSWHGLLAITEPGLYRFEIVSDDGSTMDLDGTRLIDISGVHGPIAGGGEVRLDGGFHPIHIDFYEAGGGWSIELYWARDGAPLARVPATALLHEPIGMTEYTTLRAVARAVTFAPLCWIAAGLLFLFRYLRAREWFPGVTAELRWGPLLAVLGLSALLSVLGVWWGFPEGWAADEVAPAEILGGLPHFFSNGWYSRYPPFQFFLLSLFTVPFVAVDMLRPEGVNGQAVYETLFVLNRLVSVAMATGTVALCYACANALKGRMAGVLAAAAMAIVLPFVYYAKMVNLDVPSLFWFALAMLAYVEILQRRATWWYYIFALAGMLAICTKDQAYGFFVFPAIHLVWRRGATKFVRDPVLWRSAAIAVATFVIFDNLLFNYAGFIGHLRLITGGASAGYQAVPATFNGRLMLLRDVIRLMRWSFGWPLFLLVVASLVHTFIKRDRVIWLLLPAVSYYICFLNVVLYAYDRFLLGLCFLLAAVLGCRLSEWAAVAGAAAKMVKVAAVVAFAYAVVMAVSLDAMMMWDSRYSVRRWFRANVPHDARVMLVGRPEYLPVLPGFGVYYMDASRIRDTGGFQYIVVNARFMRRFRQGSGAATLYEELVRGKDYALVLRERPALGWLPLARSAAFQSDREDPYTNITKVDPMIEVYRDIKK